MLTLLKKQRDSYGEAVAVVHHHQQNQKFRITRENGITLYRMPIWRVVLYVPITLLALRYLKSAIKTELPDVLHLHMPNATCFWLLFLPSARRLPWIVHWHSDVIGESPNWLVKLLYPVYRLFEQRVLKRAQTVLCTSPNYLQSSQPLKPWKGKSEILPLGISCEKPKTNHVSTIPFNDNSIKLITIGRLTYYKGHEYLLQALKLCKDCNIDVHLDIVGDGELKEKLTLLTDHHDINEFVTFHGTLEQSDLEQKLAQADALCLPSIERTEAFGLVLLEAMRLEVPCIVTAVEGSGMSFVVKNHETGLVVEPKSAKALFDAISFIKYNRKTVKFWGKKGAERLKNHFSIELIYERICAIYSRVTTASTN